MYKILCYNINIFSFFYGSHRKAAYTISSEKKNNKDKEDRGYYRAAINNK